MVLFLSCSVPDVKRDTLRETPTSTPYLIVYRKCFQAMRCLRSGDFVIRKLLFHNLLDHGGFTNTAWTVIRAIWCVPSPNNTTLNIQLKQKEKEK